MLYAARLTWSGQKGIEGEYQRAINRMARSTLGAFRSTPQGIIAAQSGLTPARALLDHRQARFTQRLYAPPRDGGGPEEILSREGAAATARLKAVGGTRRGEMVELQVWSEGRTFPGQVSIDEEGAALETARAWRPRDTIWTDGSRFDSGEVGAACAWRRGESWTRRRFHLGSNKEVFDAEVFAIYQALRICNEGQHSGHRYTISSDSQSAIQRLRTDSLGPGQQWARAAVEVCSRIVSRQNEVSVLWVPAHAGVEGNERADQISKEATSGRQHDVPEELRWEASLSHLSRVTTENWSEATA